MGRMSKRKKSPLVNHEVTWKTPLKAIDEEFEEVGPGMGGRRNAVDPGDERCFNGKRVDGSRALA